MKLKYLVCLIVLAAVVMAVAQTAYYPGTLQVGTIIITNGSPSSGKVWIATNSAGAGFWGTPASGGGSGTQNIQTNGIPVSDSATGTVYFAGSNIQQWATNANGRVSILTRTPTNLTFLSGAGTDMRLGWFTDDAGGAANGTGTNFGFYDVTSDQLLLWTHGTGRDIYFSDDVFMRNMDAGTGSETNVLVWDSVLGQVRRSTTINLTTLNTSFLNVSNGIYVPWTSGQVLFGSNNWIAVNNFFYWDTSEQSLHSPTIEVTNLILQGGLTLDSQSASGTYGKFLRSQGSGVVPRWENPDSVFSFIASNAATYQVDFSTGTNGMFSTDVMRANISLQLTNWTIGAVKNLFLTGDTNANDRTVTLSTNGMPTTTTVRWNLYSPTNGSSDFTVTNNMRAELSLRCVTNQVGRQEVWAVWGAVR